MCASILAAVGFFLPPALIHPLKSTFQTTRYLKLPCEMPNWHPNPTFSGSHLQSQRQCQEPHF